MPQQGLELSILKQVLFCATLYYSVWGEDDQQFTFQLHAIKLLIKRKS